MRICAAFLIACFSLSGAKAAYRMYVETEDGKVQTAEVSNANERGLTIALSSGHGSMLIPMERIKSWRLVPPRSWTDAEKALKANQAERAIRPMREYTQSILPLLNVPKGDAATYVFKYVELLRSRRDYKGALAFLEKIPDNAPPDILAQSVVLGAYCRAMLGEVDAAETALNRLRAPSRRSSLFSLYKLTRARIASARKDLVTALDEIASVIAYKRLGSESYAEALYLSAEAYDELGAAIAQQKKAIASDDKLRRLYEQNRGEAFDALGIIKSDKSSVSAIMDEPPDLPGVSIEIRKQLVRVFPTSPWATLARPKLPPGSLDKVATQQPEPEGVQKNQDTKDTKPEPTPTPKPDDGLLDAETGGSDKENL